MPTSLRLLNSTQTEQSKIKTTDEEWDMIPFSYKCLRQTRQWLVLPMLSKFQYAEIIEQKKMLYSREDMHNVCTELN